MVLGGLQDTGQVVDAVVDGSTHLLAFSSCLRALVEGGMETEGGREGEREGRRKGGGGRMYMYSVHPPTSCIHVFHVYAYILYIYMYWLAVA